MNSIQALLDANPTHLATSATTSASATASILLELRPALEGFAGIPQETRLLYRGLRMIDGLKVEGMLQTFALKLARGTRANDLHGGRQRSASWRINRYSRVIVSMAEKPYRTLLERVIEYAMQRVESAALTATNLLGLGNIRLTQFEGGAFGDFVWRTLFAKTLPAADFKLVTSPALKICSVPWNVMHRAGLNSLSLLRAPRYPRLDTRGHDIFIAQTPYPARVDKNTALVVRYHDALPVLMPHTIPDKAVHQASHFYALMENVRAGAWFACISAATRDDLLRMFPEAADRAVTIHNMVSHHYYWEDSPRQRVGDVIRSRLYEGVKLLPEFFTVREKENFYKRCLGVPDLRYLLIVSTIEPRKNHVRLLAAWEVLKAEVDPGLKLVVVGTLGWDNTQLTTSFKSWIDRGELFMLNAVPAPDLRLLYRHAQATVCPSLGEGFDYSGVEAMASGGIAIASDIAVHREIYEDASEYFDPYSTASLVTALKKALYGSDAAQVQANMRLRGAEIAARYRPEKILPQWSRFIERVMAERRPA
jgi:glycosyltransferase involved in cell wall biosynthesis